MAIHLVGDTYAHKAMVDASAQGKKEIDNIYTAHKSEINSALKNTVSITTIKNQAASTKGLTTSALGKKYFNNCEVSNKYFTDNIKYMEKRYSVATQVATGKLLNYYNNKAAFGLFVFCPYELKSKGSGTLSSVYNYKLLNLTQNVQDAGYRYADYLKGKKIHMRLQIGHVYRIIDITNS